MYDKQPFCYAFALSELEHDKSTAYPNVTTVLFDEFLSRKSYLPDEFVLFMNTLSTIIRERDNVKIYGDLKEFVILLVLLLLYNF